MTTTPTLDHHTALALLREEVAGNEDFIYRPPTTFGSCVYELGGKPDCLVGKVIRRFDPEAVFLSNTEAINRHRYVDCSSALRRVQVVSTPLTKQAVHVLQAAQVAQDTEKPWAVALERAERCYAEIEAGVYRYPEDFVMAA